MKMKSLMLHFDLFSLRENKITFLERSMSAFVTLAEILIHVTCQVMRNILLARAHDQVLTIKFSCQTTMTYQRVNRETCAIRRHLRF